MQIASSDKDRAVFGVVYDGDRRRVRLRLYTEKKMSDNTRTLCRCVCSHSTAH